MIIKILKWHTYVFIGLPIITFVISWWYSLYEVIQFYLLLT
jgi:hypothetical protein